MESIHRLGRAFAIEVHAYAIMSNHFHLVIYSDPTEPRKWSDEQVVDRWLSACPPRDRKGDIDSARAQVLKARWLLDDARIKALRDKLGSVSVFMKLLKQPIARRANLEDECPGHFFEQRFYSGALLDEEAVLAAMAYVDLNPVRAKFARHVRACRDASIEVRLRHSRKSVDDYLAPVVAGTSEPRVVPVTIKRYVALLEEITSNSQEREPSRSAIWRNRFQVLKRRQRAFGSADRIAQWLTARGLTCREVALA